MNLNAEPQNEVWRADEQPPPTGHNGDALSAVKVADLLDAYLAGIESGDELPPTDIAALQGWHRAKAISSALVLATANVSRQTMRESPLMVSLMVFVAVHSDNEFGRCTDGAGRMAAFLGCTEKTARRTLSNAIERGGLRIEVRPGKTPAIWLPYVRGLVEASAYDLIATFAPPSGVAGRPSKAEKTPVTSCPDNTEKPRTHHDRTLNKTPVIEPENPGHIVTDSNSSCTNSSAVEEAATASHEGEVQSVDDLINQHAQEIFSESKASTKRVPTSKKVEAAPADLFGGLLAQIEGIDLPVSINVAIAGETAKTATSNFCEAVVAARKRGATREQIEVSVHKSIGGAIKKAAPREPSPSELILTATTYLGRAHLEQAPQAFQPFAGRGGPRAIMPSQDFPVPSFEGLPDIHDGGWEY